MSSQDFPPKAERLQAREGHGRLGKGLKPEKKKKAICPSQVVQLVGVSTSKGRGFDPWSGRVLEATNQCLSLTSVFLSLPFSLKINKNVSVGKD